MCLIRLSKFVLIYQRRFSLTSTTIFSAEIVHITVLCFKRSNFRSPAQCSSLEVKSVQAVDGKQDIIPLWPYWFVIYNWQGLVDRVSLYSWFIREFKFFYVNYVHHQKQCYLPSLGCLWDFLPCRNEATSKTIATRAARTSQSKGSILWVKTYECDWERDLDTHFPVWGRDKASCWARYRRRGCKELPLQA